MNHYEELGVSRSAAIGDIRLAYKTLVRVLHPDQQQDEDLRRLSELQLRRLNHILEVLSDPGRRRQYDESLVEFLPAIRPPHAPMRTKVSLAEIRRVRLRLHLDTGVLVWLLIAAIAIGSAVVWIRSPEPVHSQVRRITPEPSGKAKAAQSEPPAPPSQIRASEAGGSGSAVRLADRQQAVASRQRGLGAAEKQPIPENLPAAILPVPPKNPNSSGPIPDVAKAAPVLAVDAPKAEEAPTPAVKASSASISGKWLYVPKPDEGSNRLYQAEYIELRISSRGGLLKGKYRGTYRVPDRAMSPEINFQFEGKQGESVTLLPWYSSNGSKGEMRVKRLSEESIEVNWITTSFGNSNTLASGTAVLYRSDPP
ncbi:MAG: DnaJ domain-containing protein [Bryobacteraceae bacterium]